MKWPQVGELRDTLRFRMIVIAMCVHLGIWFVAVAVSSYTAVSVILEAQDDELANQAKFIEFSSRFFISLMDSMNVSLDGEAGGRSIDISEQLGWQGNPMNYWDANGNLIFRTREAPVFEHPIREGFADITTSADGEITNWRVLYRKVDEIFWVAVGIDTRQSRQAIIAVAIEALYPMVLIIPLTIIGIYLGTTRGLRPIRHLSEALEARSPASLDPIDTSDVHGELQPMVNSLNGLLERLGLALENEHRFTANAAHELQTPLTAIKAEVQMRQRSVADPETRDILDSIGNRVDRAVHTVRQLLTLARLESHDLTLVRDTIDLHVLVEQALADLAHLAIERSLEINFPEQEHWPIKGQGDIVSILIGNLLTNAFRYTPADGLVSIAGKKDQFGLKFVIANDCAAMTDEEREQLTVRFHRQPGTQSPGAGLGLSIVERIAEVHGASITLSEWREGHGLQVTVYFPA